MVRNALGKVAWVGRTASMVFGLALVMALVIGVATTALAHTGVDTKFFHLGHSNVATAITSLGGKLGVDGPMLAITNNNPDTNDTALALNVQSREAPMRVNSTTKVANLNADMIDDREASSFANVTHPHSGRDITSGTVEADRIEDGTGSNLDADQLDGQNSNAFAPATHTHDPSYIQQSPTSAEAASIHISGTMRTSGMLRTGSEAGTSEAPQFNGLVVRRIHSTNATAGQVVARTDQLRLERDSTSGGLRIGWNAGASTENTVNCMGINSLGSAVNHYSSMAEDDVTSAGAKSIFTNAESVVYATCSFGNSFNNSHVTQVTLQRKPGDNFWVGTVLSSFNQ